MSLGSLPISDSSNGPHVRVADEAPAARRVVVRALIAADFEVSEVVAEGIETSEERTSAIDLGCNLLQGYLLSGPGAPSPEVAW